MLEIDLNLVKLSDILFRKKHAVFFFLFFGMYRMQTDSNNITLQ